MAEGNGMPLQTVHLNVGYEGRTVISDVNIDLHEGQIITLIGPNGAGKSTILKTISRYLDAVEGKVFIAGEPLQELTPAQLSLQMSVVLTERVRTELLTCRDIVETGRYPYTGRLGILDEEDKRAVDEAMELADVTDLAQRDFMNISDGQRQRILIARAICQQPRIIMLDEPTSFLDIRYQIDLLNILRKLARERGCAIIMSLHELPLASIVSNTVICVKDGAIAAQGAPENIFVPEVIDSLYNLAPGSFDPQTGLINLDAAMETLK